MKKRLIVTGLILAMLLVPLSCAAPAPAPAPSPPAPSTMPPPPVPATEGVLIEMHTKTTMAGVARHLTISVDGSIVFIEERGLRHPTKENPPTRTTRTGQLTDAELSNLLAMVDACLFDVEGKSNARTEIIDTDAISELTVHYQKRTRMITADYQPLFHLFNPKIPELSDVPETVRKLYQELRYIVDNKTTQTAPASSPGYPNHGITTTNVEPRPGESGTIVSGSWVRYTIDDLVEKSDTVLIGKVVDIFPSRQVDRPPWRVITDVVIEVERYLYGQSQSTYIVVMVPGGRTEEMVVRVSDQPVFNLGEEVALFLYLQVSGITPPEGFERAEYYMVTGSIQGKPGYSDDIMVTWEGERFTVSEVEQKIASIHGGE